MDPFVNLDCSSTSIEERGWDSSAEAPETSSAGVLREITIVLSGESTFLYDNVAAEDTSPLTPNVSGYEWASRDVRDFPCLFTSKPILQNWMDNSCIIQTLGYNSYLRLSACREDERVFQRKPWG